MMPIWPFIVGAILLFPLLLLPMPVRVSAAYSNEGGILVRIHFLCFYFTIFPRRARPLTIHLIRLGSVIGLAMLPYARAYVPRMKIRVATGDAASTAMLYGAVSTAAASALTSLEHLMPLRTKRKNMSVVADYFAEKSTADVKVVASASLYRAVRVLPPVLKKELPPFIAFTRKRHKKERERLHANTPV